MESVIQFVIMKNLILIKEIVNNPVIKNFEGMGYVIENAMMKKIIEIMGTVNVIWLIKEMASVMKLATPKNINETMETARF